MNFQKLNGFNLLPNTALLTVATLLTMVASFSSSVLAAPLEDKQPVSQHNHHNMHGTTMPMSMTNRVMDAVSMQNVPKVDSLEHVEHPEAVAHLALPDKSQITAGLRSPDYSNGYRNTASHHMMSSPNFWNFDAEKLELARNADGQNTSGQYELTLWYGNDYNRLYLNTSGEFEQDNLEQASTSIMWWRPFSTYWNTTFGLKQDYQQNDAAQDTDPKAGQTWLGGGIRGLAPYWFELESSIYASLGGHSQLELNASYDLNISQKLVLQPEVELLAYGKTDVQHGYGAGLAEIKTGLRLRYELTPQFAPYIGFERERLVGKTAKLYKDLEANSSSRKILLGIRFWY